ncbi:dicarboxylate/amino acid:cation symporter [Treponema zioleckii]|uniref:dicarboxylate/amino acid:cation symporter n=1 Tax=Treponema zioleckii TaxID=331680 RepID=UPI00168A9F47|nr:dicarboxylate/amino acid:cation symporter [Treponema zioleckii]
MELNGLDLAALGSVLVSFAILFLLKKKCNLNFGLRTLIATVFGLVIGLVFKKHFTYVAAFGTVYVNALQAFVVPLLLVSVIASITNLGSSIKLQKIGLKSVFFLLLNTLSAALLALFASVVLNIGAGFNYAAEESTAKTVPSLANTLIALFPKNIVGEWGSNSVVPVLIFGIIIALSYNKLARTKGEEVKSFKSFVDAANKVVGKAVSFIIGFTPYAVTSLIARAVGRSNVSDLIPLLGVLVVAYVLCALQIFGIESLLITFVAKLNPFVFLKKILPAGIVAFTSQSSVGTLPVTVRQLTSKLGVNGDVASFTAGLGANLGMPGCAGIWPVLLAVFTIHQQGISYSVGQYVLLILFTILVSIGTVGVPGTATITATALFTAVGLPVEFIVLFSPISSIVDMARTATNVVGAATASVLVAEAEGLLDKEVYYDKKIVADDNSGFVANTEASEAKTIVYTENDESCSCAI